MTEYIVEWLWVYPTERCTGNCSHCAYDSNPYKIGEIPFSDLVKILDQIPLVGVQYLTFTGGGETTRYKHLVDAIAYGNSLREKTGFPKKIGIDTNAYWASNKEVALDKIREFRENGLDLIRVSDTEFHTKFKKQIDILKKLVKGEVIGYDIQIDFETTSTEIIPLGRGRDLPTSKETRSFNCDLTRVYKTPEGDYVSGLYAFPNGIYACEWQVFRLGNLDEELTELLMYKVHDALRQLLSGLDYGPKRLLKEKVIRDALPQEFIKEAENLKECTLCKALFENEEASSIVRNLAPTLFNI